MAAIPNLTLVRLSKRVLAPIFRRHIMTTQTRTEKALDELSKNTYYEKYAEKIAKLQQTSPEEFLSRVEGLETVKTPKKEPQQVTEGKFSQLLNPKKSLEYAESKNVVLDDVMKTELIRDKSSDEIKQIWQEYHLQKNFIAAVLPSEDFDEMQRRAKEFPTFIFALPRTQGYEFIMSQFEKNSIHFTPLLYYQVHKENAPECLTITHYTEFKEDKKIVLMRGEYDKNVIDLKEAQCLANQLQLYYVRPTQEKFAILEQFTKQPDEFKHMDIIKQIENLTL